MGGGLMQLVAYGAQDVYLTGQPQITFFKVVYRRHTNFSVEPIQQTFQGAAEFGRTVTCNINRNGDLITSMYLVAKIDKKNRTNGSIKYGWVNKLGFAMIESCKVEVGGSKIDEQYGDWLNVWDELTRETAHDRARDNMIGNVDTLTKIGGETTDETTLYVPLKFWFNRNNGLALPLIALQYHDVRVTLKLREACDLVNFTGTNSATNAGAVNSDMKDAYLLIDYVYLDSEERKRFAQAAHEYLIEQVQFTGDETLDSENHKYRLNFNHPSKYLVWNTCLDRYQKSKSWIDWAVNGDWEAARERFAKKVWLATRANLEAPDGSSYTLSMSNSTMEIGDTPVMVTGLDGLAKSLANKVDAQVLFANTLSAGNPNADATLGNVVILRNDITIEDMNILSSEFNASTNMTTTGKAFITANHVWVRDYFNYSDHPNCTGNPIKTAKLQLNGHDRFTTRDGNYFNYVQPYQHFLVTPCDGINVYSFALKPVDHQPSGTCNFSRIDNTTLNLTTNATASNSGVCKVYCVNYNVFRVMSGMGGLAYSN
jgi:hypothetical protein